MVGVHNKSSIGTTAKILKALENNKQIIYYQQSTLKN